MTSYRAKLYWWFSFRYLGAAELSVLSLQMSPCLRHWVVISAHLFINKEISSSNIVLFALIYILIYELSCYFIGSMLFHCKHIISLIIYIIYKILHERSCSF